MKLKVELSRRARKELLSLPKNIARRIINELRKPKIRQFQDMLSEFVVKKMYIELGLVIIAFSQDSMD